MTKIETENLLALLQGIDLTAYQKGLAINEYNRLVIRINELERKLRQFTVMQRSEQLFSFLEYCDNAGWIKNIDKKRIVEDYEKANNCA